MGIATPVPADVDILDDFGGLAAGRTRVLKVDGAPINPATAEGIEQVRTAVAALAPLIDQLEGYQDGVEALLTSSRDALTALGSYTDGLEGLTTSNTAAVQQVGTRAYGAALPRLAYGNTSARSAAITATEVQLHNCGTGRCFVRAGAAASVTATMSDTPLEPGEKFHMRITSGQAIAALREDTDGNLNIIPVA